MVFSSTVFLFVFLPVFFIFYAVFERWRNLVLLCLSLVFYGFGEGYFLCVMLASIIANYLVGLNLQRADSMRTVWLWVGISINLLMLASFKYAGFFAHEIFGLDEPSIVSNVHLPIGISFFTFQSISYLVDVYRAPKLIERSVVRFGTYISMFPQLIAGPIVRFQAVSERLKTRRVHAKHVYFAMIFFAVGLAQKVLIADTVAEIADAVYALPSGEISTASAWLGGIAYSLQIFFDFSGYSSMAIGLGLVLGFEFPRNFNFPYIAKSISEFWRRWHLSLSEWFRDYVYIPMGGNRLGALRTYRNLGLVFLLTGLWHGAAWNFVFWGIWHGAFVLVERAGFGKWSSKLWPGLRILYTLIVVYVGWIFFRAPDLSAAWGMITRHVVLSGGVAPASFLNNEAIAALLAGGFLSTPIILQMSKKWMATTQYGAWTADYPAWKYAIGTATAGGLFLLSATKILSGAYSPFIYFRF